MVWQYKEQEINILRIYPSMNASVWFFVLSVITRNIQPSPSPEPLIEHKPLSFLQCYNPGIQFGYSTAWITGFLSHERHQCIHRMSPPPDNINSGTGFSIKVHRALICTIYNIYWCTADIFSVFWTWLHQCIYTFHLSTTLVRYKVPSELIQHWWQGRSQWSPQR